MIKNNNYEFNSAGPKGVMPTLEPIHGGQYTSNSPEASEVTSDLWRKLLNKTSDHLNDDFQLSRYHENQAAKYRNIPEEIHAENYFNDYEGLLGDYHMSIKPQLSELVRRDPDLRRVVTSSNFSAKKFEQVFTSKLHNFISKSERNGVGVEEEVASALPKLITSGF